MHKLILASESPRRKTLLQQAGFLFDVFSVKVSENIEENLTTPEQINDQILAIARSKVLAAINLYKPLEQGPFLFLSADTMVVFAGLPLGKPKDNDEAEQFLQRLSGQTHEVKTAVVLGEVSFHQAAPQIVKTLAAIETTRVQFRLISRQEILDYISSGEPMDKAGAYGIQGQGGKFVSKIDGPYDNVVGLPVQIFKTMLLSNGWKVPGTYEL